MCWMDHAMNVILWFPLLRITLCMTLIYTGTGVKGPTVWCPAFIHTQLIDAWYSLSSYGQFAKKHTSVLGARALVVCGSGPSAEAGHFQRVATILRSVRGWMLTRAVCSNH